MDGLFAHVHEATRRTLEANGYQVIEVPRPGLLRRAARACRRPRRRGAARPARISRAFAGRADYVVVNSAGCGALLKDYGHLLGTARARRASAAGCATSASSSPTRAPPAAARSRSRSPTTRPATCNTPSGSRRRRSPCSAPFPAPAPAAARLATVLRQRGHLLGAASRRCRERCSTTKIAASPRPTPRPDVVATGNPGCLMQIGAGLIARPASRSGGPPGGAAGLGATERRRSRMPDRGAADPAHRYPFVPVHVPATLSAPWTAPSSSTSTASSSTMSRSIATR